MAGFLTCSRNGVFPSSDSDILPSPFTELTAAGTVQDSHLFPSQDSEILHHKRRQKYIFFGIVRPKYPRSGGRPGFGLPGVVVESHQASIWQAFVRELSRSRRRAGTTFVPYFYIVCSIVLRWFIEELSNNYRRTNEEMIWHLAFCQLSSRSQLLAKSLAKIHDHVTTSPMKQLS